MRRTLITGGAGFIGSHLAEALVLKGDSVLVLDDFSTGNTANIHHLRRTGMVEVLIGSVLDERLVDFCVQRSDRVAHLAAGVGVALIAKNPTDTFDKNIQGTTVIADACARHGRMLTYLSSSEVYDKISTPPYSESDPIISPRNTKGRDTYASSKAIGEDVVASVSAHIPTVVVRPFNVSGPRQLGKYGMVLPRLVQSAMQNDPLTIYGDGYQTRSFCHIRDFVDGLICLMDAPDAMGKIFNMGSEYPMNIRQVAETVKNVLGSTSPIATVPFESVYGDGFSDIQHRYPSLSKLREVIAFEARLGVETIVRDIATWLHGGVRET